MLTGCSPFAGDTAQETYLNISQVNLDFPDDLFGGISKEAINFMESLLLKNPQLVVFVFICFIITVLQLALCFCYREWFK